MCIVQHIVCVAQCMKKPHVCILKSFVGLEAAA